jgi:hypothetical protein
MKLLRKMVCPRTDSRCSTNQLRISGASFLRALQIKDELVEIDCADLQQAQSNSQHLRESPPKLDPAVEGVRAVEQVSPKNLDGLQGRQSLQVLRTTTMTIGQDLDPLALALAPPPGESPQDRKARLLSEREAKKRSDLIDQELSRERSESKSVKPVKILLLGQSESGVWRFSCVPVVVCSSAPKENPPPSKVRCFSSRPITV